MIRSLATARLAWPLAKRDLLARYRGSLAGLGWALLAPLAMVVVYALVFRGVFQARWGAGSAADDYGYVVRLFAGLMIFQAVAEVASRAPRLMLDHANLVKRVVFPLELLVHALLMQVAVHVLLQALLLALAGVVLGYGPRASWLLLPAVAIWVLVLQYVLALALSALGAYVRDLQHMVPLAVGALLFLSPVFYPTDAAPAALRLLLVLNPVSAPIELARAAWFGDAADMAVLGAQALALVPALIGARWLFARLRPGFADLV